MHNGSYKNHSKVNFFMQFGNGYELSSNSFGFHVDDKNIKCVSSLSQPAECRPAKLCTSQILASTEHIEISVEYKRISGIEVHIISIQHRKPSKAHHKKIILTKALN